MNRRYVVSGLAAVFCIAALCLGALWAYIALAFAEPQDMDPSGLLARLLVPEGIRRFEPPGQCAPMQISLSYQECTAGICGATYWLSSRTLLSQADFAAVMSTGRFGRQLSPDDVHWSLGDDLDPAGCRAVLVRLYLPSEGQ